MTGIEPFELPTGPLRLRPWRDDDLDAVWAALQDSEIVLWNGTGSGSREDAAAMLHRRMDWSAGDHASWAVIDPLEEFWAGTTPHPYRAGEWGPRAADEMLAAEGRRWRRP